jgi:ABC-type sugar transport system permease subunit
VKVSTVSRLLRSEQTSGFLMITPFYLAFLFLYLIPLVAAVVFSFTNYNLADAHFIGLKNYRFALRDSHFLISVKNTLLYGVFTIFPAMAIGLVLAQVLNRSVYFARFFRVLIFTPYIVSMVAVSMIWLWIYDPSLGFLNTILKAFGFETYRWLRDPSMALGSLIAMGIWKKVGYDMTIYLAGLQSIPGEVYEAARIDGANSVQIFFRIVVPMLRPVTFFLFITGCIDAFKVFEQVNVMTGGGPVRSTTTIVHQIYINAFQELNMGYASAQAVILMVFVITITVFNYGFGSRKADAEMG